jgi:hypothetical protein
MIIIALLILILITLWVGPTGCLLMLALAIMAISNLPHIGG